MRLLWGAVVGLIILAMAGAAFAGQVVARVDISAQEMVVSRDGWQLYRWKVSTARRGKVTPRGTYQAEWLSKYHKSSLYDNAPMPFSIFFHGHYAVHGTDQVSRLGQPASAGCVRLHPDNAAKLFELAQTVGLENTVIVISD